MLFSEVTCSKLAFVCTQTHDLTMFLVPSEVNLVQTAFRWSRMPQRVWWFDSNSYVFAPVSCQLVPELLAFTAVTVLCWFYYISGK